MILVLLVSRRRTPGGLSVHICFLTSFVHIKVAEDWHVSQIPCADNIKQMQYAA